MWVLSILHPFECVNSMERQSLNPEKGERHITDSLTDTGDKFPRNLLLFSRAIFFFLSVENWNNNQLKKKKIQLNSEIDSEVEKIENRRNKQNNFSFLLF